MATTVTADTTTAVNLPVAYVDPGRLLAGVFANLDGWEELSGALQTLAAGKAQPRLAYAYQPPQSDKLLAQLVLDVSALGADEGAATSSAASSPVCSRLRGNALSNVASSSVRRRAPLAVASPSTVRPDVDFCTSGIARTMQPSAGGAWSPMALRKK